MKSIYSLVTDIQYLLTQRGWVSETLSAEFSHSVAARLQEQFKEREGPPTLRLSRMGPMCPCALWHSIHYPELAEKLPPWAEFKYSFGHIIEAQAIMLARATGHSVEGEQDEVIVDGITGHLDCIVDGCVVDVKSCTGYLIKELKSRNVDRIDAWGYLSQLDGYLVGSLNNPLVTVKDRAYLLAIDKQLGHMYLYEHFLREDHIRKRIADYIGIVRQSNSPACSCDTVPDGMSGNIKLDVKASYNPFKHACNRNLRTFLYSDGPRYLTKVVRKPDVPEVDKYGKMVYN